MNSTSIIRLRNPRPFALAVYVTLGVLAAVSLIVFTDLTARVATVVLCAAYGLVYRVGYYAIRTLPQATAYFAAQTLILTALVSISGTSDVFGLLFFILGIFPVLRAGALSYVLKDVGVDALADAIRKAAVGDAVLHPRVAARVIHELQGNAERGPNLFTELSERELDVLRLVAQGLSNADIAAKLVLSERTVKGHVSNILSKLHVADRTQAAVYAWREGVVKREA